GRRRPGGGRQAGGGRVSAGREPGIGRRGGRPPCRGRRRGQVTPAFSAAKRPHLQFILDGAALDAAGAAALARAAVQGGVDSIQVRAKQMGAGALLELVLAVIDAVRSENPGALVLVNERADV